MLIKVTAGAVLVAAIVAANAFGASPQHLGAATHMSTPVYQGYYDGHKDAYMITDVSNKSQASALHVNYSALIRGAKGAPRQFFIQGKAAPGQLSVFGSEPGEPDYNPLWDEIFVTWKAGATPVLLKSDNQIDALAKQHKLTETDVRIVDNAPIISVGAKMTVG